MRSIEQFAPESSAAREVRIFLRQTLSDWQLDALEWSVTQAVTELATNVILHARTPFSVEIQLEPNKLVIGVTDQSPRRLAMRTSTDEASTGRGLALVAHLSDDWGTRMKEDGKTVWCSFNIPSTSQNDRPQAQAI